MSTVNISLPQNQVRFIDSLVGRYKFANRSELVRSFLRLIEHKPGLLEQAATFPFASTPPNQSVKEIVSDFKKTKKYSPKFLKDLQAGLASSDYFKP